MMLKSIAAMIVAGFVIVTSDFATAQGQNREAMAAKCRAQVSKAMPGGDISMKTQKQRMFRVCMQNGGKL
jgi:hypothetical protein